MTAQDEHVQYGIRVPKHHGERIRQILLLSDRMDHRYRIQSDGDWIIIPLPDGLDPLAIACELEEIDCSFTIIPCCFEPSKIRPIGDYREVLTDIPPDLRELLPTSFDVVGTICLVKLHPDIESYGQRIGDAILATHSSIDGIFQDKGVTGEFRVRNLHHLAGEPGTTTTHTEYGLRIIVDVKEAYFSPRLAAERYRVASLVSRSSGACDQDDVQPGPILDMFAGVGPYALAIARRHPETIVHAIDINPRAVDLMRRNIDLNKIENVTPHCGDSRVIVRSLARTIRFNRIIMNLPHDALDFLHDAMCAIDSGMIHLYSICAPDDLQEREAEIRSNVKGTHTRVSIDSKELKGYSPTDMVYSHDISIEPLLKDEAN